MANRTDVILLLASSSFLALGLATWYEHVNDKPFSFASIFGKTDAHAASTEPSLNEFLLNSKANATAFVVPADAVPANRTDIEAQTTPVETAKPAIVNPGVKPPELTRTVPAMSFSDETESEVAEVDSITTQPNKQNKPADQTRIAARTVTIVLSPQPAHSVADTGKTEIPLLVVANATEVTDLVEASNNAIEDSDAAGQLLASEEQQPETVPLVTRDTLEMRPRSDDNSQKNDGDQMALKNSEPVDNTTLPESTKEAGSTLAATSYRVEAGDSLYRIALTHGTSVDALKQLNALQSDKLYVGDELQLR